MEQIVLHYNRRAVYHLNRGDFVSSLDYLNKAKSKMKGISLNLCSRLMGITLNNFGCYYKSLNEPQKALTYLSQAVELEKNNLTDLNNLAATYMNICAAESQLGNHLKALENCLKAIHLLKPVHKSSQVLAQTFVTAHYNASVQYKALGQKSLCKSILEVGLSLSKELLGNTHFLTKKLEDSLRRVFKIKEFFRIGKNKTSAASSSFQKNLRSDVERSTDTYGSTLTKLSRRFMTPDRFRRTLHGMSPLRLGSSRTTKVPAECLRPRKFKPPRNVVKKREMGIQVSGIDPIMTAAVRIQRAWRRYKSREKNGDEYIDKYIKNAEAKAQGAYYELLRLRSIKSRLRNGKMTDNLELKPVPYRLKYFN